MVCMTLEDMKLLLCLNVPDDDCVVSLCGE